MPDYDLFVLQRNILILALNSSMVRMVTNHHVTKDGADLAATLFVEAVSSLKDK